MQNISHFSYSNICVVSLVVFSFFLLVSLGPVFFSHVESDLAPLISDSHSGHLESESESVKESKAALNIKLKVNQPLSTPHQEPTTSQTTERDARIEQIQADLPLNRVLIRRFFENLYSLNSLTSASSSSPAPIYLSVIGGSISLGIGCSDDSGGFMKRVASWFSDRFSRLVFEIKSAARSATQSNFGSLCINTRLGLRQGGEVGLPNLLILEYAINDYAEMAAFFESTSSMNTLKMNVSVRDLDLVDDQALLLSAYDFGAQPAAGSPAVDIVSSVERIIRWAHQRQIPVLLLAQADVPFDVSHEDMLTRPWDTAAPLHHIAANHYNVPVVDWADYTFDTPYYVGTNLRQVESKFHIADGRHPNCEGHALAAALIINTLRKEERKAKSRLRQLDATITATQYFERVFNQRTNMRTLSDNNSADELCSLSSSSSSSSFSLSFRVLCSLTTAPLLAPALNPYMLPDEDRSAFECVKAATELIEMHPPGSFTAVPQVASWAPSLGVESFVVSSSFSMTVGVIDHGLILAYTKSWRRTGVFRVWLTQADGKNSSTSSTSASDSDTTTAPLYTIVDARQSSFRATQTDLVPVFIDPRLVSSSMTVNVVMHVENYKCPYEHNDSDEHGDDFCFLRIGGYFKY